MDALFERELKSEDRLVNGAKWLKPKENAGSGRWWHKAYSQPKEVLRLVGFLDGSCRTTFFPRPPRWKKSEK